ncbi:MAG: helix-turn-helix domain-containing protein [Gammaproteobacteria bacterium]|nr:helix-turn-helix domain-containing protein [Gammaproteobacteria bacterium]NIR58766.1 helix-turn-helix domain-containing protein [Gammaproteobacteria bacterium]NIV73798.1 helix-turn-helix domain-containing protein [Gammaproteobacteria bacterium]
MAPGSRSTLISVPGGGCETCALARLCVPPGLDAEALGRLERLIERPRPLGRGTVLVRSGQRFDALLAVHSGAVKAYIPAAAGGGREQVIDFRFPGDLIGLEAVSLGRHPYWVQALETTTVCRIPFEPLERLSEELPALRRQLLRLMSRTLAREEREILGMSKRGARQRLAAFLLDLARRFRERGYSSRSFRLAMSRSDIAAHLGLDTATVSRLFTAFRHEGLLAVERKDVRLQGLRRLADLAGHVPSRPAPRVS